jgi:RNA polymerase primary sigma factor
MAQTAARLRREEEVLTQELGRQPSAEEVASRVGVSAEQVEEARRLAPATSSLDGVETDEGRPPEEWLLPSTDPAVEEKMALEDLRREINDGMVLLTPREQDVLRLRYGLDTDEPRSLAEVGRALAISRQRARELEQSALRRLRHRPFFGLGLAPQAGD